MTRIVAGVAGGRRLVVPEGEVTRPTSDRVREALFSTLGSMLDLTGLRVLDLYAGSGALGLEALSRGAGHVTFVERDHRALSCLRRNVASTRLGPTTVRAGDVARVLGSSPPEPADLVLADPPYRVSSEEACATLAQGIHAGWLADDALVVLERPRREPDPEWPGGLEVLQRRDYGETRLWYLRRSADHAR
jgi:16S rRNA (guanine966-N2)-methyltransferase